MYVETYDVWSQSYVLKWQVEPDVSDSDSCIDFEGDVNRLYAGADKWLEQFRKDHPKTVETYNVRCKCGKRFSRSSDCNAHQPFCRGGI